MTERGNSFQLGGFTMKRYPLRYKSDYIPTYCYDPDENVIYALTSRHKKMLSEDVPVSKIYAMPDLTKVNVTRGAYGVPSCLIDSRYIRTDWLVAFTMYGQPEGVLRLRHLDNDRDNYQWQNLRWSVVDDIKQEYCEQYGVRYVEAIPEIWRTIAAPKNSDIVFSVSNRGRVVRDGVSVRLIPDVGGYLRVQYQEKGTGKQAFAFVHRLVAALFVDNPDPDNCKIVNHMDGNKTNNCFWNLEWVTESGNAEHAVVSGLSRGKSLTAEEVERICSDMASGMESKLICSKYGIDIKLLSGIRTGRRWKQISDKYTFPSTRHSAAMKAQMLDMIEKGMKAKEISEALNVEWDGKFNSLYERLRRYLSTYPDKVAEIREAAKTDG